MFWTRSTSASYAKVFYSPAITLEAQTTQKPKRYQINYKTTHMTDCGTPRCRRCIKLSSSPGCCTPPAPGGASSRPPTGSASRAFYTAVCVPVTASRMRRSPLSWSKRWTINCSTESDMLAATSYIHCFPAGVLSRTACVSGVTTTSYLWCRQNSICNW